jgi:hypothetical protein
MNPIAAMNCGNELPQFIAAMKVGVPIGSWSNGDTI